MAKQIAVIYAVPVSFAIIVCPYSLHYTNSHLEAGISLHLWLKAKGRDKNLFFLWQKLMFLLLLLLLLSASFFFFFFTLE